jgi:hypothetical protein
MEDYAKALHFEGGAEFRFLQAVNLYFGLGLACFQRHTEPCVPAHNQMRAEAVHSCTWLLFYYCLCTP